MVRRVRRSLLGLAAGLLVSGVASSQSFSPSASPPKPPSPRVAQGFCGPASMAQGTMTVTSLNSVSCNAGGLHTDSSYYRAFDLLTEGVYGGFVVCGVDVGVELATGAGGDQPLTVNLYTVSGGPFPAGTLNLIGTASVSLPDQSGSVYSIPVDATAASGSQLVVEVFAPNGQVEGNSFFIGSNTDAQDAPSYIKAADCGISAPTDVASIGFPDMHIGLTVRGTQILGNPPSSPPECHQETQTFTNATSTPIPDVNTMTSQITVSGVGLFVRDLDLQTFITHTFPGDLDITLTSPEGSVVKITTDNGGTNDNAFNGTVWNDAADPGNPAPYPGNPSIVTDHLYAVGVPVPTLSPEQGLAAFNSENPNGTWTLTITDDAAVDTGTLASWSLGVTTLPGAATSSIGTSASNSTPTPIADAGTVTSTINYPGGAGTSILTMSVTTNIEHTFAADLDITLTSPAGTTVTLTTDNGGGNDNVFAGTTWYDGADPVADHAYANMVVATPLSPEEGFGAFIGENPTGTWTLTIVDDLAVETGTLQSWSIALVTSNCVGAMAGPVRVDEHASGGSSNVNGVFELGEQVRVETSRYNPTATSIASIPESATGFTGGAGATYTLVDGFAAIGALAPGETVNCWDSSGNCYEMSIVGSRPSPHFDATFQESAIPIAVAEGSPNPNIHTYSLHVGESFGDVPQSNIYYRFIETIFHNGITTGGSCGGFCPGDTTLRKQMAVFVLKAKDGLAYIPPAASGLFPDVPAADPFAPWIEELANRGVVSGCGGGHYCPNNPVLRQQMAIFLLKSFLGSAYVPPAAAGVFTDVPSDSPFAPWVEDLYSRGVTGGCNAAPLQFCPSSAVTRAQMAVFLTKTFGLLLYGP